MAEPAYRITQNAPLQGLNTLRVAARAERLVDVFDSGCLQDLLALPDIAKGPIRVLGGGSNLLICGDVPGTILRLCNTSAIWPEPDQAQGIIQADAGLNWHTFVMENLMRGWQGLENLALIPGTVGAAPIQNIGAYGLEVGERITSVSVFDRDTNQFDTLPASRCGFAYRDSVFKQWPDRYIVIGVAFALVRSGPLKTHYPGVTEELSAAGVTSPTAQDVAAAVIRLRQRKLPDPEQLPNAGSFFKNPIVTSAKLEALRSAHPDLPSWPTSDGHKLSAGWLIEHAGLKGARTGDAGIAPQHALILVNHGTATGAELRDFAAFVKTQVDQRFGVTLAAEPVYW